jgi:16S rRNA (uracil1498-N3)-methyltransferase
VLVADPERPAPGAAQLHHLERVLRLRPGERVVVADGRGRWGLCAFTGRTLEPVGPVVAERPPAPVLTVAFVPAKGERPEWVVQKLTEVGIDRIVVLRAARGVVRWGEAREHAALTRLRRVAAEATAQSRRVWLPEVLGVVGLDALGAPSGGEEGGAAGVALAEPGGPPPPPATVGIAVGPEGGWTEEELAGGWPTVSLGDAVLRAETAAVVAGVLLAARRAGTVEPHEWPR